MTDNSLLPTGSLELNLSDVISSKFAADSLYTLGSIFLLGLCGLLLNLIIALKYGALVLGVFNLVYAAYIISSQFATLGVQVSALKHVAQFSEDKPLTATVILAALLLVVTMAAAASLMLFWLRHVIAGILKNPDVATGILYVIPGLWCFSVNKLFLNILNGLRMMKAYTFFIAVRYFGVTGALLGAVYLRLPGEKLSIILSVSELFLIVVLSIYCTRFFRHVQFHLFKAWVWKHLIFGTKSFMAGVTAELNTRVDVLILGYFLTGWHVGIYSFAAVIVEGMMMIPYVLKQNMDPILAKVLIQKKTADVESMIRKGRRWATLGMLGLSGLAVMLFPLLVRFIVRKTDFMYGWPVFCILLAGTVVQSGVVPFSGILVQGGAPGLQTLLLVTVTLSNIILNIIFVYFFGIIGAAIATALSLLLFVVYFRILAFRALGIHV